jgi:methanogenic corrinoid protein MtbC1
MQELTVNQQASEAVLDQGAGISDALLEQELSRQPELIPHYGKSELEKSLQDAGYHLSFLAQALALGKKEMFLDYVAWAKVMLCQRNVPVADLAFHLECLADVLRERLPGEPGRLASAYVAAAARAIPTMPEDMPTFLHQGEPLSPLAHLYLESLRRGERQIASRLVLDAVSAGTPVKDIYLQIFQPALYEIGRLWQINKISVAEEHYCTAATQLVMSQLYPFIFASTKNGHTLVATCVVGDLHEIGVRMVADFFELDGWDTYYLGASTPDAGVIAAVIERKADVLAVSATISYHVDAVRTLIAAVRRHRECGQVKILAGGYPFNEDPLLWEKVGADGSAANAQQAVVLADDMVKEVCG